MGTAAMAIGMIATSEVALACRCPSPAQRTSSGIITNPPPTPKPAQKPDRRESGRSAYSPTLGAGAGCCGSFVTTEWWRNWTSAAAAPPGCLAFFFFLTSRPCLFRPFAMGPSFDDKGQFAQEGFDVGDQADRLPGAPIGELGHDRWVDVDAHGPDAGRQHVACCDRVQHRREHQRNAHAAQARAHPL